MSCPVCGSSRSGFRHRVKGYAYLSCGRCGAVRVAPFPAPEEAARWYRIENYFAHEDKDVGYRDYLSRQADIQKTFAGRNRLLRRRVDLAGKDVLEIGCGPGFYPATLRPYAIRSYLGLDLNPLAVEALRRRGFKGFAGGVEELDEESHFDIAVFFDVFEHILNPNAFLAAVNRRLRPNGIIFFTTPSTGSLLARLSGRRWVSYIVPQHVVLYNEPSLRWILDRHGFEILDMKWDRQRANLPFLMDRLTDLFSGSRGTDAFSKLFSNRGLSISAANGMRIVIARRSGR
jgi:SAM-dependent methyltransferase